MCVYHRLLLCLRMSTIFFQISQGEVDAPKISNKDYDLENPGYPPKILCEFIPKENAQAKSCSFFCTGLKGNPDFHVLLEPPKAKDGSIQTQVQLTFTMHCENCMEGTSSKGLRKYASQLI